MTTSSFPSVDDPLKGMDAHQSRQTSLTILIARVAAEINTLIRAEEAKGEFVARWKIPADMSPQTTEEIQRRYQSKRYVVTTDIECSCSGANIAMCSCKNPTHLKFCW